MTTKDTLEELDHYADVFWVRNPKKDPRLAKKELGLRGAVFHYIAPEGNPERDLGHCGGNRFLWRGVLSMPLTGGIPEKEPGLA